VGPRLSCGLAPSSSRGSSAGTHESVGDRQQLPYGKATSLQPQHASHPSTYIASSNHFCPATPHPNLLPTPPRHPLNKQVPPQLALSICVLGASGDLARKKTYPALFALYSKGFLPNNLQVRWCVGVRSLPACCMAALLDRWALKRLSVGVALGRRCHVCAPNPSSCQSTNQSISQRSLFTTPPTLTYLPPSPHPPTHARNPPRLWAMRAAP